MLLYVGVHTSICVHVVNAYVCVAMRACSYVHVV